MSDQDKQEKRNIDIQHEENRQENLDAVVWDLEQKVEKLENSFQHITVNLTGSLTNEISSRINLNIEKFLPKIHMEL